MTDRELITAWAAGFLEGEGSFCVNTRRSRLPDLRVKAVQVDREPLERLRENFGGSISRERRSTNPRRLNRQDIYIWTLTGDSALSLMVELAPLLSERRRGQIATAISQSSGEEGVLPEPRQRSQERLAI